MLLSNLSYDGFDNARVLVVGDLMLDRFRYGKVSRISPEAPVPVFLSEGETMMLGGAGNVVANVGSLEGKCGLISVIGDDEAGQRCKALLGLVHGCGDHLIQVVNHSTTVKTRYVSGSQHLMRCDDEVAGPYSSHSLEQVIATFDAVYENYDIVALSDYAKGVLSDAVLTHILSRCKASGKAVVVDPKRKDFSAYAGATVIKPNRLELGAATGISCTSREACEAAAQQVISETGSNVLLTMSEDGMALYRPNQPAIYSHATANEVYDVSGAGDTSLATFCAALSAGHSIEHATYLANAAAGIVVRKLGTAIVTPTELRRELYRLNQPVKNAIADIQEAIDQVAEWKQEGLTVGFTNGCFDIVHGGHIALLRQAAETCDRLVVGLNSDTSVSRLKGPARPIQGQTSRAQVLAAMKDVDLVVIFEEDTPLEVIQALSPTDLIKGADYTEDNVVGAKHVKERGGRVHLVNLIPGLSTTRAVERIRSTTQD